MKKYVKADLSINDIEEFNSIIAQDVHSASMEIQGYEYDLEQSLRLLEYEIESATDKGEMINLNKHIKDAKSAIRNMSGSIKELVASYKFLKENEYNQ